MDYGYDTWGGYFLDYNYIRQGSYTVTFSTVSGWAKPDDIDVTIEAGGMEAIVGQYTQ